MDNVESKLKHVIQVILKNIQDVSRNLEHVKANAELDEPTKNSIANFSGYHLLVLSILLDQLASEAKEWYPEAVPLIEWAQKNYNYGVENKSITPCSCPECVEKFNADNHAILDADKLVEVSA